MAKSTKKFSRITIENFLTEMKSILTDDNFNIEKDFDLVTVRAKDDPDDEYTNTNTLLELEYDSSDVVEELKTLSIQEYVETMLDTLANEIEFFHVFGRKIKHRDVYIKVRLKKRSTGKYVFCVSFHFARHHFTDFPYK